jgi:glycosyltransferase involved in cell wall biosynthesis
VWSCLHYNSENLLNQAIESVLAQTYPNWELIVVDDGSTDNTAQIVSNFKDRRIVSVYQKNRGQAATLNRGLDAARGEYVTTLDVDDWYTPNSLQDRALFLDGNPQYDVVYGDGVFCDLNGNELKRFSEMRPGEVVGDVFDILLSNAFFGTGANVMVRKSALEKFDIRYDETIVWCQDYDLYLRLAEKCRFGYVDSIMVWYRLHTANMTMSMPTGKRRESLIRTKFKALNSPRFARVDDWHRYLFFSNLILHDLDNCFEDQKVLLDHPEFQCLSGRYQSMLIRHLAAGYLVMNRKIDEVKILLSRSWRLNPFDLKTVIVAFFARFRGGPITPFFRYWQTVRMRTSSISSPFDHIKE